MKFGPRPFRFLAVPVIALLALSACSDDPDVDDTLSIVRVNVGTGTVLVDANGVRTCCDGAGNPTLNSVLVIPAIGTATARSAVTVFTFHRSNGTPILLDPATHEVRVTPATSAITWTPAVFPAPAGQTSLPFSGTLARPGTTAAMVDVSFSVVEKASGSVLFGPQKFTICTTQQAAVAQTATTPYVPAKCLT
jgi:hypothetical protein